MINKIIDVYKHFEKVTTSILKNGLKFCSILCLISLTILSTYLFSKSLFLYNIGIAILKLSIIFSIEFIICGFVVDGIKKQLI